MYPSKTDDPEQPKHSQQNVFCLCEESLAECVAMHNQTEKMIKLVCFFTLHANSLAGFITQSILGQTILFSGLQLFYEVSIQRGA